VGSDLKNSGTDPFDYDREQRKNEHPS